MLFGFHPDVGKIGGGRRYAGIVRRTESGPAAWGKTLPSVKGSPEKTANTPARPEAPRPSGGAAPDDRDTGEALRRIYQRTVDEAVPDDFMSLLDKLD